MKRTILSLLSVLSIFLVLTSTVAAQTGLYVNAGYWKSGDTFDVVVHEKSNDKLKLYVNDKTPTQATVNKKGWATFHKVKLDGQGKVSFTQVFTGKNKKSVEKPFNYTQQFTVNDHSVKFNDFPKPQVQAQAPAPAVSKPSNDSSNTGLNDANLSNNNTYTNSDGATVHSPATSTDGSIPAGATAKCGDGTFSFSQHRSGTCSHHGGVAEWL